MRVLCCLDGTNIEHISRALSTLATADERTIGLLYVTDLALITKSSENVKGSCARAISADHYRKKFGMPKQVLHRISYRKDSYCPGRKRSPAKEGQNERSFNAHLNGMPT